MHRKITNAMDNLDGPDKTVKVSDSIRTTSCSNNQSRRSHSSKWAHSSSYSSGSSGYGSKAITSRNSRSRSSKSTHSSSHSSESSGYGGKPLTSGGSNNQTQPAEKRVKDKDGKKKKSVVVAAETPPEVERPPERIEEAATEDVRPIPDEIAEAAPLPTVAPPENAGIEIVGESNAVAIPESKVISNEVVLSTNSPTCPARSVVTNAANTYGFWSVISMTDGVVMYTTPSITTAIGFRKEIFIGRSFIDFIHPMDRNSFASQITRGLATPEQTISTDEMHTLNESLPSMFCRIRRYRSLRSGFGVKDKDVLFSPFLLQLSFKQLADEHGKTNYLVVEATPFYSYFKIPNEPVEKATPFVLRHSANGTIEYIGPESVPFLGYLPQELTDTNVLLLYQSEDLPYLKQLYEHIVKQGKVPVGEPFGMLAHNGDYVKVETEWSSFINPWSKKLEFIIGKHRIVEGPLNPDVFAPRPTPLSCSDDVKAKILRDSIVRIMNEILTKPVELAKQPMTEHCQDLASFMEDLMEEQSKNEDNLKLENPENDHQYYEPDSVMLGGISPHYEHNDGDSSTETPLTYNQLNYNENLHRYFQSYEEYLYDSNKGAVDDDMAACEPSHQPKPSCSTAYPASRPVDGPVSGDSEKLNHQLLTELIISKHNSAMEKNLVRKHRENRNGSKGDRDKVSKENRQKKKDHLAKCNAYFQPAFAAPNTSNEFESVFVQPHGMKRASKFDTSSGQNKYHCSSRQLRRRSHTPVNAGISQWNPVAPPVNLNSFVSSGVPQIPIVGTVAAVPGTVFPMYYMPATTMNTEREGESSSAKSTPQVQYQSQPVQYMMLGPPFMYSPISTQVTYPVASTMMPQSALSCYQQQSSISLPVANYESTDVALQSGQAKTNRTNEEGGDRTDESSYSSFYSSFFKTESGSAEEESDQKAKASTHAKWEPTVPDSNEKKKLAQRKKQPPWMEHVSVTSEHVYKYQLMSRNIDDVLKQDQNNMKNLEQPSLVNEQLSQLYIDLQLEGVAARLTLEDGLTSSGSSGEETTIFKLHVPKVVKMRRKREYSKLAMIYEEDAPFPPAPAEVINPEPAPGLE